MMTKPQSTKTPAESFKDATEGKEFSSGDLRLLTSGLVALRKAHEAPLNNIELQSIYSMVAYVAYTQGVCEHCCLDFNCQVWWGGRENASVPALSTND